MRLASITFEGFRRFFKETTLKTNSKMTVLIGPNEAGKSSVLRLLSLLNNSDEFSISDRYKFSNDAKIKISATFHLEAEDHDAIGSSVPQNYILSKDDDGRLHHRLEPKPKRSKAHRAAFKKKLGKAIRHPLFRNQFESDDYEISDVTQLVDNLDISVESFDDSQITFLKEIQRVCIELGGHKVRLYLKKIPQEIDEFLEVERLDHPNTLALQKIDDRVPKFIEFTDSDREWQPSLNMMAYKHETLQSRQEPCNALCNLCEISNLDLDQLKKDLVASKLDRVQEQIDNANLKIEKLLNDNWSQSGVFVYLSWQNPEIQIMARVRRNEGFNVNLIDDRSDGFRQYAALLAFIIKEDAHRPILLIDEAEQHLHYDAQADLIQVFTEKNLASQVIYSTHSAGCLPEDLGLGVKLVVSNNDGPEIATSHIENNFWSNDKLGFSPLLYGMGAQTLAFFPTRKAVVTEGQSEMLLMPTIFRQVSGQDFNGFQIVPSLANASKEKMKSLSLQGEKVSYLLDNDVAGRNYFKTLKDVGVPESNIFYVSGNGRRAVTVEDWIADDVFAKAMATYQERYFRDAPSLSESSFKGDGKAEKLKNFEKSTGGTISKTTLAYIILEQVDRKPTGFIYNQKHKKMIQKLRLGILDSFK